MISRSLTSIFVYVLAANVCFAGFWDFIKFWEDERVDTLLVAGNYTRSRLLAELVQKENDSPIILFSPEAFPNKFYYLSADEKAVEYDIKRLQEFVAFINPKSIVVFGGEKYVGKKVVTLLDRSSAPWSSIKSSNWNANAQFTAKHFGIKGLTKEYFSLLEQIYEQKHGAVVEGVVDSADETLVVEAPIVETPVAVEEVETPVVVEEPVTEEPEVVMPVENDQKQLEVIEQTPQK